MTGLDGYLLDTCIVSCWHDKRKEGHPHVVAHLDALPPDAPFRISAITLGEMEYGHSVESPHVETPIQVEFRQFVTDRLPNSLEISRGTAVHYGRIRARLFEKFVGNRERKRLRPEQLVDPVTSRELGIHENDLWIAAQAVEYRLVLVTGDSMNNIRTVVGDLLRIENWSKQ